LVECGPASPGMKLEKVSKFMARLMTSRLDSQSTWRLSSMRIRKQHKMLARRVALWTEGKSPWQCLRHGATPRLVESGREWREVSGHGRAQTTSATYLRRLLLPLPALVGPWLRGEVTCHREEAVDNHQEDGRAHAVAPCGEPRGTGGKGGPGAEATMRVPAAEAAARQAASRADREVAARREAKLSTHSARTVKRAEREANGEADHRASDVVCPQPAESRLAGRGACLRSRASHLQMSS